MKEKEILREVGLTEGEIKAYSGYLNGLDIAGIGGIHNFIDKKTCKKYNSPLFQGQVHSLLELAM